MASKLSHSQIENALEVTQGKSSLKKSVDGLQAGDKIRKHMAGSYTVATFEVIGMASPALYCYLHEGANWKEELRWYEKDTVVLKDKDNQYYVWILQDAIDQLKCNKKDNSKITALG